jgi:hypothetical protein
MAGDFLKRIAGSIAPRRRLRRQERRRAVNSVQCAPSMAHISLQFQVEHVTLAATRLVGGKRQKAV